MSETPENLFTATITTSRDEMTLPELARMLDALAALGEEVAIVKLAVDDPRFRGYPPEDWVRMPRFGSARYREFRPRVLWVRNESPVAVALAEAATQATILAATLWVLRHPERISSWPWRVMAGYHEWSARERAMRMWAREVKDAAGGEVEVSDLPPPPRWLLNPDEFDEQ